MQRSIKKVDDCAFSFLIKIKNNSENPQHYQLI